MDDIYTKKIKSIDKKNEVSNSQLLLFKNGKIENNLKKKYDISIEFITKLYKLVNMDIKNKIKINKNSLDIIEYIYKLLNNTSIYQLNKELLLRILSKIKTLLSIKSENSLISEKINQEILHFTIAFISSFKHFLIYYFYLHYQIKIPN